VPDEHDRQHYRYRRTVGAEPGILAATAARRGAIRSASSGGSARTCLAVLGVLPAA